ncbi:hypothetical protein AVEN_245396-1, partial [Araneus ventricosus]
PRWRLFTHVTGNFQSKSKAARSRWGKECCYLRDVFRALIQRTVANWLLQGQLRARRPVACIPLIPNHCRLRREWCQARAHWRTEWRSVVFSDESWFSLGASDGRVLARGSCNQPVCGLYTLELWSGEQFPMTAGALSWLSHSP